jgi:chemotaxis protein MotB
MARYDDDPPRRRGGFPAKTFLAALLFLGAAVGAGYYAWQLRAELIAVRDVKTRLEWEKAGCGRDLDQARLDLDRVGKSETECRTQRDGLAARQAEIDAHLAQMETNLSATKEELEQLRKQRTEAEARLAAFRDLTGRFKQMIDTGKLEVATRKGNMVVQLPAEVLFPSGSADLSDPGKLAVLEVGVVLKQLAGRRFMIVGHTDSVPVSGGVYSSNWELSTARAVTVTRFLIQAGLKADNLVAAGAAEFDAIADNKSTKGRQQNRRIEIVLLPDLKELPPLPAEAPPAPAPAAPAPAPAPAAPAPPAPPASDAKKAG